MKAPCLSGMGEKVAKYLMLLRRRACVKYYSSEKQKSCWEWDTRWEDFIDSGNLIQFSNRAIYERKNS